MILFEKLPASRFWDYVYIDLRCVLICNECKYVCMYNNVLWTDHSSKTKKKFHHDKKLQNAPANYWSQTLLCKFWATQCHHLSRDQKVSMGRYRLNFFTDFRVINEKNSNALCKLCLANMVIILSVFHSKEVWIRIWYVIWNE